MVRADKSRLMSGFVLKRYTPEEAAARLGFSVKTLLAHVRAGAITYMQIGGGSKRARRIFLDSDLEAFAENNARRDGPGDPNAPGTPRLKTGPTLLQKARAAEKIRAKRKAAAATARAKKAAENKPSDPKKDG